MKRTCHIVAASLLFTFFYSVAYAQDDPCDVAHRAEEFHTDEFYLNAAMAEWWLMRCDQNYMNPQSGCNGNENIQPRLSVAELRRAQVTFGQKTGHFDPARPAFHNNPMWQRYADAIIANLRTAAEHGNPYASEDLGFIYKDGQFTERNVDQAVQFFKGAAACRMTYAENELAYMYVEGVGLSQSYTEASRWFGRVAQHLERSSSEDNRELSWNAYMTLAFFAFEGKLGSRDIPSAIQLFSKADAALSWGGASYFASALRQNPKITTPIQLKNAAAALQLQDFRARQKTEQPAGGSCEERYGDAYTYNGHCLPRWGTTWYRELNGMNHH